MTTLSATPCYCSWSWTGLAPSRAVKADGWRHLGAAILKPPMVSQSGSLPPQSRSHSPAACHFCCAQNHQKRPQPDRPSPSSGGKRTRHYCTLSPNFVGGRRTVDASAVRTPSATMASRAGDPQSFTYVVVARVTARPGTKKARALSAPVTATSRDGRCVLRPQQQAATRAA